MKNVSFSILAIFAMALLLMTFSGCKKNEGCTDSAATNYDPDADKDNGSCIFKGQVTFWNHASDGFCEVAVSVAGTPIGVITLDFTDSPSCGANGAVTFTAPPGVYSYSATEEDCDGNGDFATWTGTVTVTSNGCLKQQLTD